LKTQKNAEMMEATFGQDLKKLEYLWTRGASIDCHDETNGYTPLHWCPFPFLSHA